MLPRSVLPRRFLFQGGEHDVWTRGAGRVLKATRPNEFGTTPYGEGTPYRYFDRLQLQNLVFGDDTRFEGIALDAHGAVRVITSQPWIEGTRPALDEIAEYFGGLGFRRIAETAYFHPELGLIAADGHEKNLKKTAADGLVPIDLILAAPEGEVLEEFRGRFRLDEIGGADPARLAR